MTTKLNVESALFPPVETEADRVAHDWEREQQALRNQAAEQVAREPRCEVCAARVKQLFTVDADEDLEQRWHEGHIYHRKLGELLQQRDAQLKAQTENAFREETFKRLLSALDGLHYALLGAQGNAAVLTGLLLVQGQFDETLKHLGVERVQVGILFDPAKHEAVDFVESYAVPAQAIVREVLPGYMRGGRLLRAARVVVSRGPVSPGALR